MSIFVKRTAAAAFALSMGIAMTACSSSEEESTAKEDSTAVSTQTSTVAENADVLEVSDLVVRATTSSMHEAEDGTWMTGIFGNFTNNTDVDQTIVGFTSDTDAKDHQVHEIGPDGMMREKEGGLTIKAGETAELKPGGEHLMLMGMSQGLQPGDKVQVTLELAGGQKQDLGEIEVRDISSGEENYGDLADGASEAMHNAKDTMGDAAAAVTDAAGDAAESAGDALESAGDAVESATNK